MSLVKNGAESSVNASKRTLTSQENISTFPVWSSNNIHHHTNGGGPDDVSAGCNGASSCSVSRDGEGCTTPPKECNGCRLVGSDNRSPSYLRISRSVTGYLEYKLYPTAADVQTNCARNCIIVAAERKGEVRMKHEDSIVTNGFVGDGEPSPVNGVTKTVLSSFPCQINGVEVDEQATDVPFIPEECSTSNVSDVPCSLPASSDVSYFRRSLVDSIDASSMAHPTLNGFDPQRPPVTLVTSEFDAITLPTKVNIVV